MAGKKAHIFLAAAGIACILYSCNEQPKQQPPVKKPEHTFSVNGSVREIKISPELTEFPDHAGKAEFVSYCAMCHSLRYVTVQPDFPRHIWEAEVTKMVEKYHAPIDSATCRKITDYLVAIKGIK
ncbi:MAG: hypothetical protein K0Q79_3368 [Flavipsychrobacter sp.]|jgi:hypothetical protein|nr:hypothetical protein [Flavipsychrobacter sp.]